MATALDVAQGFICTKAIYRQRSFVVAKPIVFTFAAAIDEQGGYAV